MIIDAKGFYKLLEVPVGAQPEEIRAAHKRLSKIWHPDINPCATATDTMARINEAFRVLSDPGARYSYDRLSPPPSQITSSGSSIHLNRRSRTAVISITSNCPIKDVSCDHLDGSGWKATIRIVSECSIDVTFVLARGNSPIVRDFTAVIDGSRVHVSVSISQPSLSRQTVWLAKARQPVLLYLLHLVSFYAGLIGIYCQIKAFPLLEFSGSRDQDAAHLLLYAALGIGLAVGSFYVVGNITGSLPFATPVSFAALLGARWWATDGPLMNGRPSHTGINLVSAILLGALIVFIHRRWKLVR